MDALTGLYNRRYLMAEGESFYQAAIAAHRPIHVLMIDIDHFKQINDNYGHLIGDKLLEGFSELLQHYFSDSLVARFGGEEFCILNDICSVEEISARLNRLNENLVEKGFTSENVKITYSGGVVSEIFDTLEGAVKVADIRLYLAKNNGRNQVCCLSEVG
jgi:diguanylate cyclase (GGDEF)-like protein